MKTNLTKLLIATTLLLTGCDNPIYVNGEKVHSYGIMNRHINKQDNVCYEITMSTIVIGVLLVETIIVPAYLIGYTGMDPIKPRNLDGTCN